MVRTAPRRNATSPVPTEFSPTTTGRSSSETAKPIGSAEWSDPTAELSFRASLRYSSSATRFPPCRNRDVKGFVQNVFLASRLWDGRAELPTREEPIPRRVADEMQVSSSSSDYAFDYCHRSRRAAIGPE